MPYGNLTWGKVVQFSSSYALAIHRFERAGCAKVTGISSAAWSLMLRSRQEWGAEPGRPEVEPMQPLQHPIPKIRYIENTGTPRCRNNEECDKIVKELQLKHMAEGLGDIRYNFLVGDEGVVYEGRGWHVKPPRDEAHADKDGAYLEIALIGDLSWETERYAWMISPMCDGQWSLIEEGLVEKYVADDFEYIQHDPKAERQPRGPNQWNQGQNKQKQMQNQKNQQQKKINQQQKQKNQQQAQNNKQQKQQNQQRSGKNQPENKQVAKEVNQNQTQTIKNSTKNDLNKKINASNGIDGSIKIEPTKPFVGPNMYFDVQSGMPFEIPKRPESPVEIPEATESEQSDSQSEKPTTRPTKPLKPPDPKPSDEPLKTPEILPIPAEIPETVPVERPSSKPVEMPSTSLDESPESRPMEFPGRPFKRPDDQPEERPAHHPSEYPKSTPIERHATSALEMPRQTPTEYSSSNPTEYTNNPL